MLHSAQNGSGPFLVLYTFPPVCDWREYWGWNLCTPDLICPKWRGLGIGDLLDDRTGRAVYSHSLCRASGEGGVKA